MPQPTLGQSHIDAILTNISVAYMQQASQFISPQVFPIVPVEKKSNKYFVYRKGDWFRDEAQRRADATESAGSGYNVDTDNYSCNIWAFHKDVGDQVLANADTPLSPMRDAAAFVANRLLMRQEVQWASDFLVGNTWGTGSNDLAGVASGEVVGTSFRQWSDYTSSDPIEDVELGKDRILSTTGFLPNVLVIGYQVFRKLRNHPDIVDRIKYTSSEAVTTDIMARLFGVDRVLVAQSIRNTADEGATNSFAYNVGKVALLINVADSPGLLTPSAGYTFAWTGVSEGLGATIGTSEFRLDHLKATRVEGEIAFANKIVAADLGQYYTAVVA